MKILLINPEFNFPIRHEMFPSLALLTLGKTAEYSGCTVKIMHIVADKVNDYELENTLKYYVPDLIGLTISTFQTKGAKRISQLAKRLLGDKVKVVGGGAHPTSIGEQCLIDFPHIDQFVLGEGEVSFPKILHGDTSTLLCTETYTDLDALPFPDPAMVNTNSFIGTPPYNKRPIAHTLASRGCPYNCSFCNKAVVGKHVRYMSPEAILQHLQWLHLEWKAKEVFFQDDTFNLNREWLEQILHGIISRRLNKQMVFRTPFRANAKLVDLDLLKLMREAGFWLIFYGVESGNQYMLDRMQKGLTLGEIERAFKLTHEAGIKTEASFIIGLPGETQQTIQDSLGFWHKIKPFWTGFSNAIPFPSTELDKEVRANGKTLFDSYDDLCYGKALFTTDMLNEDELNHWIKVIEQQVKIDKLRNLLGKPRLLANTLRTLTRRA